MRAITKSLIKQLSNCSSLDHVRDTVGKKHAELKKNLELKGIEFDLPEQNIKGGQRLNANEYHDYDEINHIQRGLNISWVHYNMEYSEIENMVKEITNNLL